VRARLIAVGAAIAIIGAGVIAAVTLPHASPHDATGSVSAPQLHPGLPSWIPLNVTPADRGSVTFTWTSSQLANVEWYAAVSCSTAQTWCVQGEPLKSWHNQTSGEWSASGPVLAIYSVSVNDTANVPLNFSGQFHEEISETDALLPMLPLAISIAGGALLLGMGGVAAYLGIFLPSNVYSSSMGEEGLEPFSEEDAAFVEEPQPPHVHSSRPPPL
jgi:hypothetical protein